MTIHISFSPSYRLRLNDGGYVFMSWHHYGPTFYRDRRETKVIEDWHEDPEIVRALTWFQKRGCRLRIYYFEPPIKLLPKINVVNYTLKGELFLNGKQLGGINERRS